MKQFSKILKFELMGYLRNKVFVGITVFLVATIAIVMFIPNIIMAFESGKADDTAPTDLPVMLIYAEDEALSQSVINFFESAFVGYNVKIADGGIEDVKTEITSGSAECAFVMNSNSSYTYYVNNLSMYDVNTEIANNVLQEAYRMSAMVQNGQLSMDEIDEIIQMLAKAREELANDEGNS